MGSGQFLCTEIALMSLPHMAMSFFILTLWDHTPGHRGSEITWGNRLHRIRTGLGLGLRLGSGGQRYLSEQMLPEQQWERRAGVWVSQGTLEAMVSRGQVLSWWHTQLSKLYRFQQREIQGQKEKGPKDGVLQGLPEHLPFCSST